MRKNDQNPLIEIPLRGYPGWVVRLYADGTFTAADTRGPALSPVTRSFADAVNFVRHGESRI